MVEMLLGKGASIDLRTKDGCTALMCASKNGHWEVVGRLLANGASIERAMVCGRRAKLVENTRTVPSPVEERYLDQ